MSSRSSLNQNNARRIRKFVAQSDWAVFKHSAFKFNPELEGYHDFVFGASAHDIKIHHLFHELGHAAEFGVGNFHHRALPWGFRFRTPVDGDKRTIDPVTCQMTEREVRTIARQIHLTEASGYACIPRIVAKDYGVPLRWLPDHCNSSIQYEYTEQSLSAWGRWITNCVLEEYLNIKQKDVEAGLIAWLDETQKFQINYQQ